MKSISGKQKELANLLVQARRNVSQFSLPDDLVPDAAPEAYAVNQMVAERLGWEPLGWKIAGTTDAVRGKLQLDGPIYGRTFRRFACTSPVHFKAAELLDPLIECEFFVTLARDLPPRDEPWTFPETIAAIADVHAGIEVAECRYPRKALPPLPGILADGSASGRYVFGDRIETWRGGLASIPVRLEVDGALRREGVGADVMGDPLRPLWWLAEQRRQWGDGLRAGETISTGSMTGMLPIRAGQHVRARFGDAATIEITIDL
ncbi:2-keto-4-pentenoate hydratase [Bradyrhizobium sp. URHC0002]